MSFDPRAGLCLAFEGSTRQASVAAYFRGKTAESSLSGARQHQSDLLPTVDAMTRDLGASPRDLVAVLVGTGPGSYTGLRVSIATALGLASAAKARLLGVPSGEIACLAECGDREEFVLLSDARSHELYFGRWRRVGDEVEPVSAVRVVRVEELPNLRLDAAVIQTDVRERLAPELVERVRFGSDPHARALLQLGMARLARGIETKPEELEPLYLRPFAATERKR